MIVIIIVIFVQDGTRPTARPASSRCTTYTSTASSRPPSGPQTKHAPSQRGSIVQRYCQLFFYCLLPHIIILYIVHACIIFHVLLLCIIKFFLSFLATQDQCSVRNHQQTDIQVSSQHIYNNQIDRNIPFTNVRLVIIIKLFFGT